jgi:hypothetical protein
MNDLYLKESVNKTKRKKASKKEEEKKTAAALPLRKSLKKPN